jgi:hypothetical protein
MTSVGHVIVKQSNRLFVRVGLNSGSRFGRMRPIDEEHTSPVDVAIDIDKYFGRAWRKFGRSREYDELRGNL